MKTLLTPLFAVAPVAALFTLAACGEREPDVVGGLADDNADIEQLDPAALPPSETGSNSYRCDDGSVVYVTYFSNDAQVGVRAQQNGPMTILPNEAMAEGTAGDEAAEGEGAAEAETETEPPSDGLARYSGEGQTLVGGGNSITYNGQSCNA